MNAVAPVQCVNESGSKSRPVDLLRMNSDF